MKEILYALKLLADSASLIVDTIPGCIVLLIGKVGKFCKFGKFTDGIYDVAMVQKYRNWLRGKVKKFKSKYRTEL